MKEKLQEYALIAEIIGGAAIVASLIFVGIQISQNSTLLEAQARYNHKDTRLGYAQMMATNPELVSLVVKKNNGGKMSQEEDYSYQHYTDIIFSSWQWEFNEALNGNFEAPVNAYRGKLRDEPATVSMWEQVVRFRYPDDFVVFMDGIIKEL